ncbi:hypothetical protein [uncultured Tessaracoccus sp.]|uniref:hypothetical protein n=1 Tax=uncultured Tessaracoccus sp. TaxID=905023 RepID=UPI00260C30F7|nr:hypothetical protein [uncultured Tessaracoccus sp.]
MDERIAALRRGDVDVRTGLADPDPAVRFEAELLTTAGPAYHDMSHDKLVALARTSDNADVLADIYEEAERRGDSWLMLSVASNPRANADTLRACEQSGLPGTRAAALNQLWHLGLASTEDIATSGTVEERVAVVKRCSPVVVAAMAADRAPRVTRAAALRTPELPTEAIRTLAQSNDEVTRLTVAEQSTERDILDWLLGDGSERVRDAARESLDLLDELLSSNKHRSV